MIELLAKNEENGIEKKMMKKCINRLCAFGDSLTRSSWRLPKENTFSLC